MPHAPCNDFIVLRVGEIFLKGRNRNSFYQAFLRNARRLIRGMEGVTLHAHHLRAVVEHPPELRDKVVARLQRLFGLHSLLLATGCAKDLDALTEVAVARARALAAGTTFKVETKRSDKRFPMTSQEISIEVGGRVAEATNLPVDVHTPQRTLHLEVGKELTFVYDAPVPGPGGLPVGVSGKVSLLLSGGIDSPVAGWSAMRRGCVMHAVYFHSFPYTGDKTKEKVLDIARILARWQGQLTVDIVDFTDVQKSLREHGPGQLAVLLYRRMMMRTASLLARRVGSAALVTGENLGQVASQTLANIGVIQNAATLPILRPLITLDKAEIIDQARRIGTYETSILPYDDCCSLFVPKHPATRARIDVLESAEQGLDVWALAQQLAEGTERVTI